MQKFQFPIKKQTSFKTKKNICTIEKLIEPPKLCKHQMKIELNKIEQLTRKLCGILIYRAINW